ncbi:hypothetical protein ASD15_28905 [Massilia sp. Root351]|nr:hypothetical protein ASD15_28905 [Massilia sp. Root351]
MREAAVRCRRSAVTPASPGTVAAVGNTGQPAKAVSASSMSISACTCCSRSGVVRSTLFSATAPRCTPSRRRMARCSSVCGMMPSSAAMTSSAKSMPVMPAAMVRMNFSWPGTSIMPRMTPSSSGA